ncbi:hypothetical protein [Dubosiella newyorkensis]|jgi:hypothetical protein|uniref:hypothetical protein n=1 Tax=Dubosiella newyorkensis TaxID=1862672 RepID=UPI001177A849|nr:hypothetical protein [Dubosiella newyorkensis]MCI9042123.1 hypothetical protein [Dubosiella newyorkensis]
MKRISSCILRQWMHSWNHKYSFPYIKKHMTSPFHASMTVWQVGTLFSRNLWWYLPVVLFYRYLTGLFISPVFKEGMKNAKGYVLRSRKR